MEFLAKLGINKWLLLAQVVNFLLLLLILNKFVFKPLLKILDQRSKKITTSLKEAEETKNRLEEAEKTYQKKVLAAKKESQKILFKAETESAVLREKKIKETKNQVSEILTQGKKTLQQQKIQTLKEAEKDLADLVTEISAKFLTRKITVEDDQKLIKKVLTELKSGK